MTTADLTICLIVGIVAVYALRSYLALSYKVSLLEYKLDEMIRIQTSAEEDIEQLFIAVDRLNDSPEDSSDVNDYDLFWPFHPSSN